MNEPVVVVPNRRPDAIVISKDKGAPGQPGPPGQPGTPGPAGPPGPAGKAIKFNGHGPPSVVVGAEPGDLYLDLDTGYLYQLS